jgi:3alpha(or 20beta)-hydroxysteroid dehydrogenase
MGKLDGRVALVTGAARGMGAAHAQLLAAEGASVAVCDVLGDDGAAVAQSIGGAYHELNVAREHDWARVVSAVTADVGPVTILVNNAGIGLRGAVQETSTEDWDRVMAVNVTGVFFGIRAVAPVMKAAGGGVIVNVSSDAALAPGPNIGAYAASKWAVRGLTKAAALDLAPDNIRVVSLHPGLVRTPMSARVDVDAFAAGLPIPRPGEPEELAKMMLFIVADATYSTGCEFVADGGHTAGSMPVELR